MDAGARSISNEITPPRPHPRPRLRPRLVQSNPRRHSVWICGTTDKYNITTEMPVAWETYSEGF